ncbi:DUF4153 domain-containing protein [Stenotrophomonas oahuensis]|uniref:DUF4153 domain-containing protein n=1 Tax=Stenotrophomonas oahuensis TaxID=3003271 RepID=A0ABY9YKF0_9GAMM|nr:DUF4153 domain-containing protein [Stenotrophomonas sp. A5586]WNH51150.1 DUF4153 domain-containing protein [Stenotrophomonas sp. A5586]
MNDATPPALPLASRAAIVLIALLQGLALYAVFALDESAPFNDIAHRCRWMAWVLTVPTAMALTLVNLRDRRMWLHVAVGSIVVLLLASWIGWNVGGDATGMEPSGLLGPFSICMAAATFIILPYWQYRLQHGHWRAPYPALFELAWQNALTLALAALFTGLTWMLLGMGAGLFLVVNIDLFQRILTDPAGIAVVTGTLMGFGVLIGRTQHRAIQVIRLVLFALCRGLLPLLSLMAVVFLLILPFTGLASLWTTPSAASLLIWVSLLLVVFTNAVYQHHVGQSTYPRWLRHLVDASLLVLPIYAGLALYAMYLRIAQYGWTLERFWGVVVVVLVSGYAVGYALAVLRRRGRWLEGIETANRWMCWTVLATALLASSPVLDGTRISVASQVARLQSDPAMLDSKELIPLRFKMGRRGVEALRELRQDPQVSRDARAVDAINKVLARETRWSDDQPGKPADNTLRDVATLQRQLSVAKGLPTPSPDWWTAVVEGKLRSADCLRVGQECVVLVRDLDGDGNDDLLLCELTGYVGAHCVLHVRENGQWRNEAAVNFLGQYGRGHSADEGNAALRAGQLEIHDQRWPRLALPHGKPVSVDVIVPEETAP